MYSLFLVSVFHLEELKGNYWLSSNHLLPLQKSKHKVNQVVQTYLWLKSCSQEHCWITKWRADVLTWNTELPKQRIQETWIMNRFFILTNLFFQQFFKLCEIFFGWGTHGIDSCDSGDTWVTKQQQISLSYTDLQGGCSKTSVSSIIAVSTTTNVHNV